MPTSNHNKHDVEIKIHSYKCNKPMLRVEFWIAISIDNTANAFKYSNSYDVTSVISFDTFQGRKRSFCQTYHTQIIILPTHL